MKNRPFAVFAALLLLLCVGVYGLGLHNELVFDDVRISDGGVFRNYGGLWPLKQRLLSYGSFTWVQRIAGDSMPVQRVINLLWHLGAALGVYQLMRALLARVSHPPGTRDDPAFAPSQQAALAVGMVFFLLAPMSVYAVGYLIQRSIVMATFFSAWACWSFVRGLGEHAAPRKGPWFAAAFLGYVLAVLSKEQAFLVAGMAVPLYIFVARPPWRKSALVVAAAVAMLALGLALLVQLYPNMIGRIFDDTSRQLAGQLDRQHPGTAAQMYPLSVLNQAYLFFYYGLLWVVPHVGWMSIDMRPAFPLTLTAMPQLLGAVGYASLLAASVAAVLRRSDTWGFIGLCLLFPLILFWTEFATVWVQDPMVLYRSYLWAVSIPGLVAVMLTGWSPRGLYVAGAALALAWAGLAAQRVLSMETELSVWSDAIDKMPAAGQQENAVGRYRAYLNRGAYHLNRFSPEPAMRDFEAAQNLGEPTGGAMMNMGVAQQLLKRHDDALRSFAAAEAAGYRDTPLYYHRAESLYAQGQFAGAAENYGKALTMPQTPVAATQTRLRRAESFLRLNKLKEAAVDFNYLTLVEPKNARYLAGLGMAHIGQGDGEQALEAFNRALASEPNALGHYGRALAHARLGHASDAMKDLDEALRLEPRNSAFQNLKQVWAKGVRFPPEPS